MSRRSRWLLGATAALTLALVALPLREPAPAALTPTAAPVEPAPLAAPREPLREATVEQLAAQATRAATLDWKRDPFAPPPPAEPPLGRGPEPDEVSPEVAVTAPPPAVAETPAPVATVRRPRLSGVSRRGAQRWALIDGEVVREGDALSSGHLVIRIGTRSATVHLGDEELTLNLGDKR